MTDEESINALLAQHVAAVNARDVKGNISGFADDVAYLPPDGPAIFGVGPLEEHIDSAFEAVEPNIQMTAMDTQVIGEWAFQWGTIDGTFRQIDGGDSSSITGYWLYIYRREPDGSWKIVRDIYNARPS